MQPRVLIMIVTGVMLIIGGGTALDWQPERQTMPAPLPAAAALPLARPGQAWGLVQRRLADGVSGLALPADGLRVDLVVRTDSNGMITATDARLSGTTAPVAVTRLIRAATRDVPFALAGPAGRYRLWLKLQPAANHEEQGRI
jgi:hypothetical protein